MSSDFERLQATFLATGVNHFVYSSDSGLDGSARQERIARFHDLPEDVVEAGNFARAININGVTMFFDVEGQYVGNTDTTRALGPRFERPCRQTVERVKSAE